jgi:SAM-dependent methyltransferase
MTIFGAYSRYYDLLYRTKDYVKEVEYVSRIVAHHAPEARTLLDVGCGTGIHACAFARAGYRVTAVDRSEMMLEHARERAKREIGTDCCGSVEFVCGDIRDFELSQQFDVVVALFHVISYLPTNDDLHAAFFRIGKHLGRKGLLIFDHWYGPAVLASLPTRRVKSYEDDALRLFRIATPRLHLNKNIVDVKYDFLLIDKSSARCEQFTETHRMRYLFWPELEAILVQHNFQSIGFTEWLSDDPPSASSWNAVVSATVIPEHNRRS